MQTKLTATKKLHYFLILLFSSFYSVQAFAQSVSATEQAVITIVDQQLIAYNNQDIEAFAATYHDDVEVHTFPGGLKFQGKEKLIAIYGKKFAKLKCLNASSLKRIVNGRFLVDHELAVSCSQNKDEIDYRVEVIASYEVEDGLIKRVIFMR